MSDEEFDSFEAEDGDRDDVQPIDDDEISDRHRPRDRCDLSMAMTQKLFGNPGGSNMNHVEYEESAYVEPRNRFEVILKEENVRIINEQEDGMMDMDVGGYEKCVVFGGNLNHEELIRNLEKRMETDRGELFREFEIACEESQETLQLYLSPSKSPLGLQDTIFRAFLQIRSTQTKSFDLLLQKLNILAKKTEESDLFLAQTCVAHMRHLNRLFEPQAVFNTIFEFEWRFWSPNVRNDLIAALPEIFTDIALQQHTALRLNKEIAETQGISDLPSFQLQIVETLRLLRMDQAVSRQIRMNLCNNCMELDVHCLPHLIAFSLASLLNSGGKTDDDEMNFHEMLRQLSRLLKIEALKKKTNKSDTIVTEIFAHFLKFLQLDKRYWKYIISWISRKAKNLSIKDEPGEEEAAEEPPEDPATWLTTFEAFLIFSLLSNSDSCPQGFVGAVNTKFLTVPTAFTTKFLKIVDLMISFKRFSASHFRALIHVARHCFWSPDSTIRQMGVSLWKQLFVGMEKKERVRVFTELMKHFSQSETECEAVLDVLFKVIKSTNSHVIQDFSAQIQKCIEWIHKLSIPNVKRLFQVMLMMNTLGSSKSSSKFEIDEIINRFLISVSEREKFLGVLALLMKIQVEMGKKHSENQERLVQEGVNRIEEAVQSSSSLRGAFYEHMKIVLQQHKRAEEIRFISEWSLDLLKRFKEDFFEFRDSPDSDMGDSNSTWILKPDPGRLLEIAPMFELIKELLVVKMRWREEDQDSITSSYEICVIKDLNFAFEAIAPSQDHEIPTARDSKLNHLFFLVQWCRTILNAFLAQTSTDFLSSDEVSRLTTRTFKLMMEAEKKLAANLIGSATWQVPNLKFQTAKKEDLVVVNTEKTVKSRGRKRKSDETQTVIGEDTVMGEEEAEEVEKELPNVKSQLKSHYVCLKLRPLVHILKLAENKRSCLKYLCDEIQDVFDHIIRQKKKTPPMLASRSSASPQSQLDKMYHGDAVTVWFCVKKVTEQVWGIVELVFEFFSALPDASQQPSVTMQKDLEELGEKSLKLMHCILSGDLYGTEEKLTPTEKSERKSVIIRIIEKKMLAEENRSNDVEHARVEVGKYLAKSAEFSPTPAVAVAILNVFEDLKLDEDEQAETRKVMDRRHKAPQDFGSVGTCVTNKVVQLVPEDDKRKSCVFTQQSDDDLLEREDKRAVFYCISKTTFGTIFKTIFSSINARCLKYDMSLTAAKNKGIDEEDTLDLWETASSSFLVLCLLLRIKKIRTTAILTTAVREGKQFLLTVSKKSSFIYLMDNITKGSNFEVISRKLEKILMAVQQGNRVLQSIGNYAKTNKCVHLLKKFPELRAESENCLRVIHSAMVKNECLNAFTVGLVKSRSLDGEIITNQPNSPMDSDEE